MGVTSGHIVYAKQKDIDVKVLNIYLSALPVKALCLNQCIDTFLIYQHSIIDNFFYWNSIQLMQYEFDLINPCTGVPYLNVFFIK